MNDLEYCPFCGSDDIRLKNEYDDYTEVEYDFIECNDCGVRTDGWGGVKLAIEAWNRRYTPGFNSVRSDEQYEP